MKMNLRIKGGFLGRKNRALRDKKIVKFVITWKEIIHYLEPLLPAVNVAGIFTNEL